MTETRENKRWVLITGANGGVGRALVKKFLASGYSVIATDIHNTSGNSGDAVEYFPLDLERYVIDENYANSFNGKINSVVRGSGLSALINTAALQLLGPAQELTREQWAKTMNVNVTAPFFLIQSFLPMLADAKGAVVNISSIHATLTKQNFTAYATSKAALSALTRNIVLDIGSLVRVNSIDPAAVETEMLLDSFKGDQSKLKKLADFHPIKRLASPDEIAELAVFLASDRCSFIQGANISASGGIHACLHDPQ